MNLSVYFVTPHNPSDDLVLAALKGGATMIQLRDKTAPDDVLIEQARRLAALAADFDVPFIINDRLTVALESGASGLHMGQSDGDPVAMRNALGPNRILGLSIENEDQLAIAAALPEGTLDYIGCGPVRATASKQNHATPIGLERLCGIAKAAPFPCVGIGSVKLADIPVVKAGGCAGLAIVSAISEADDPEAATRALIEAWEAA